MIVVIRNSNCSSVPSKERRRDTQAGSRAGERESRRGKERERERESRNRQKPHRGFGCCDFVLMCREALHNPALPLEDVKL